MWYVSGAVGRRGAILRILRGIPVIVVHHRQNCHVRRAPRSRRPVPVAQEPQAAQCTHPAVRANQRPSYGVVGGSCLLRAPARLTSRSTRRAARHSYEAARGSAQSLGGGRVLSASRDEQLANVFVSDGHLVNWGS